MARVNIMGVPVDALSMSETVDKIIGHIERGDQTQHMAINPATVVRLMEDARFSSVRRCSDLADGLIWFSILNPTAERVTGIGLMDHLMAQTAQRQLKPYF